MKKSTSKKSPGRKTSVSADAAREKKGKREGSGSKPQLAKPSARRKPSAKSQPKRPSRSKGVSALTLARPQASNRGTREGSGGGPQ